MNCGLVATLPKFDRLSHGDGCDLCLARGSRLPEKQQYAEEHRKHADGGDTKNILDAQILVHPGSDDRAERAADVDQSVVNRIADGADVFFRCARGSANDAGLYQRNAQRGKHENE